MDNTVTSIQTQQAAYPPQPTKPRLIPRSLGVELPTDMVQFGSGKPVSNDQAMKVVLERSMEKLRAVVSDAKKALGMSEGAVIDTSPDATAQRITDFALGAFEKWRGNHDGLADDEARKQFADFIGGAIGQGIDEARGILSALNALSPEISSNIDKTYDIIQQRLNDFVEKGL